MMQEGGDEGDRRLNVLSHQPVRPSRLCRPPVQYCFSHLTRRSHECLMRGGVGTPPRGVRGGALGDRALRTSILSILASCPRNCDSQAGRDDRERGARRRASAGVAGYHSISNFSQDYSATVILRFSSILQCVAACATGNAIEFTKNTACQSKPFSGLDGMASGSLHFRSFA